MRTHLPLTVQFQAHRRRAASHLLPITILAVVANLALLGPVGASDATTDAGPGGPKTQRTCDRQLHLLPGLTPTSWTRVSAMSDTGLIVGTSADSSSSTAVVWTDPNHVISTGVGGVILDNGRSIDAQAVDVNETGQVAINVTTYNRRGRRVAEDAVVWSQAGGATFLPAPPGRPRASLAAINDEGAAVGVIRAPRQARVPAIWTDGVRSRLPHPPKIRALPADINNKGLVVGSFYDPRPNASAETGAWVWRLGGGKGRRLEAPTGRNTAPATDVNDSERIVGGQPFGPGDGIRTVLWSTPRAHPRRIATIPTTDLHNSGYLALTEPGFRGFSARPYIGRLRDGVRPAELPYPPTVDGAEWNNIRATALARGQSAFAPQGGVTVAGYADDYDFTIAQAIVWTCTQTLL